jgi:hypothetical protein
VPHRPSKNGARSGRYGSIPDASNREFLRPCRELNWAIKELSARIRQSSFSRHFCREAGGRGPVIEPSAVAEQNACFCADARVQSENQTCSVSQHPIRTPDRIRRALCFFVPEDNDIHARVGRTVHRITWLNLCHRRRVRRGILQQTGAAVLGAAHRAEPAAERFHQIGARVKEKFELDSR